jgi:hypothetical protein
VKIELLGVPVRIDVADPALLQRLHLCYATALAPEGDETAIECRIEPQDGGYRTAVTGRETQTADDPAAALRHLHHELLHAVMRARPELFFVHAGVVELDGEAVILPGLSQAGKSTLVLAFVLGGAGYLSDELLCFDAAAHRCRAYPRAIKIRDLCLPYFPRVADRFVGSDEGRFLPFDALDRDFTTAAAPPGAIVVPRYDQTACDLVPLGPGKALLELARSALNFGTHRSKSLDHLSALVEQVPAFALRWNDPERATRQIRDALARARA